MGFQSIKCYTHLYLLPLSRFLGLTTLYKFGFEFSFNVRYLAGSFDSLPDTEVDDCEDCHETKHQLPARRTNVFQTATQMKTQHTPPALINLKHYCLQRAFYL